MGKAYVYYSFEEYGRGYIGARNRSPVDDVYFGTFSDKTFNPTQKVVLAEFETFEEALTAEVELHAYFEVDVNPHFANKARQTSSGFYFDATGETRSDETKRKMSAASKGKPRPWASFKDPEVRAKAVEGRKGYRHSGETKRKITAAKRKHWRKEVWDEICQAIASGRRFWGPQSIIEKYNVSAKTVCRMAQHIKQGHSWEEVMSRG